MSASSSLPGGSLKSALLELASGKVDKSPFPANIVEETRTQLRLFLKRHGFGDGLPQEGDVDQLTEVRLIQGLLAAFEDPDHYFCEW